jgi:hypothetical protein
LPLLRPSIRINAALDLRKPLLVLQDHCCNGDRAANNEGHNRYQQSTQAYDRINKSHERLRKPTTIGQRSMTGFLVELTGIEPVASWLQTRRSPS